MVALFSEVWQVFLTLLLIDKIVFTNSCSELQEKITVTQCNAGVPGRQQRWLSDRGF